MSVRTPTTGETSRAAAKPAAAALPNSNSIRLSWREWAIAAVLLAAALWLLPARWPAVGRHFSRPDYRLPSELGSDYWMFRQWSGYAAAHSSGLVLGDSVMWGQYARSDEALSHQLNALLGRPVLANLGVDGLHPAAMEGLVSYYGGALRGKPVLVQLNPLWMMSPEQDLQGKPDAEARFNHQQLVAQVFHRPSVYRPAPADVAGTLLERYVPFLSWKAHLVTAYYEGLALPEWSVENPYALAPPEGGPDAFPSEDPGSPPAPWTERGIEPQNAPWVTPADSYQWHAFQRTVELLRSRGDRVFVLVGPFNTHALTPASRARYQAAAGEMEKWLEQHGIPYQAPPVLPTELYADASHPLAAGYRQLAEGLLAAPSFQEWLKGWAPDRARPKGKEQT